MKHEEGAKIKPFTVWTKVQKHKHKGLTNHANMRPKEGYKGKWQKEVTNSDESFNSVEEGLKISFFTVQTRAQNSLHIGLK